MQKNDDIGKLKAEKTAEFQYNLRESLSYDAYSNLKDHQSEGLLA